MEVPAGGTRVRRRRTGRDTAPEEPSSGTCPAPSPWPAVPALAAAAVWEWLAGFPEHAAMLMEKLGLTEEKVRGWTEIANRIYIPYDSRSGLIEQFQGYLSLEDVELDGLEPRTCSVWDLLGPERTRRLQIIKQPDVLMLFCLLLEEFPPEALRINWDYYEPRTDHRFGSSLGPAVHAILACRVGDVDRAYEHFLRAALVDLQDLRGNTSDGIHAASCGGCGRRWCSGSAAFASAKPAPLPGLTCPAPGGV
ncbi:MAG: hypothetical protein ACUVTG_04115 [Candidatus Oleimicrobiaceae bacterium]